MKTVFSSQDGKQIIFLFQGDTYMFVWKSVFLFKSPSHRWAQTTGTPELLPQISQVKFAVNKTNKSQAPLFVFCGYRGNRYILPFKKRNVIFLNVNRTPRWIDKKLMHYTNLNK